MIHNGHVKSTFERILAIEWQADDSHIRSSVTLLREYLRRSALWAKALECTEEWPFFDVAARINPSFRADPTLVEVLMCHLVQFNLFGKIKQTCEWSLHWAAVRNTPEATRFTLPEPYEPLLLMYERGGTFTTEHGFFCVSEVSFRINVWSHYYQLSPIDLDETALDHLDRRP